MNNSPDRISKLILIAQVMIGLVVIAGLLAFLTLDPYLLTLFAFAQAFLVFGVVLFVVAAVASHKLAVKSPQARRETVRHHHRAYERIYLLNHPRRFVAKDSQGSRNVDTVTSTAASSKSPGLR